MTNKLHKAAITSAAIFFLSFGVVFADEVTISDNGYSSDNTVVVTESSSNITTQENTAIVGNSVVIASNTGVNEASGNTGGEVNVTTGDTLTAASVENKLNENYSEGDECCEEEGLEITVKDNGAKSDNTVFATDCEIDITEQENLAMVENMVEVSGNTGENEASGNTGGGVPCEGDCEGEVGGWDPSITTGNTEILVDASTTANLNKSLGGDECCEEEPVTVTIKDNGYKSKNKVKLFSMSSSLLFQKNFALVGNLIGVSGNTGENTANGNTGGEVNIMTGNFSAFVSIFNKLNKNIFK